MRLGQRKNLARLLKPSEIAFIGGADAEVAINEAKRRGFSGSIWPVNPKRDYISDYKCFRSVLELPYGPDAVFLAIPASQVTKIVKQLSEVSAGGIVCYTAGFRETGGNGNLLEKEIIKALGDMVLVGPNCYGIINYLEQSALWPFAHGGNCPGYGAAIITQSGMLSSDITMSQRSLPLTHMISVGNQASLKISDFVNYLIDSDPVRAFGLHIESIDNIQEFENTATKALKSGKPIVVLKTGVSQIGATLTQSHTGSFAGSNEAYKALFERLGIITVTTPSELIETLKFICISGIPRGKKCVAFTCSGGGATLVADLGDPLALELPKFSEKSTQIVSKLLPKIATVSNPLDYTTPIWGKKEYTKPLFQQVINELNVDSAILVQDYPTLGLDETKIHYLNDAEAFAEAINERRIPGAVISTISENIDSSSRRLLLEKKVAPLQGLSDGLQSITKTSKWAINRKKILKRGSQPLFKKSFFKNFSYLDEWEAKSLISKDGIKIPKGIKSSGKELIENAKKLAHPLVVKLLNRKLIHKTDYGAVQLNIKNEAQLKESMIRIKNNFKPSFQEYYTDCFLVEEMMPRPICELIIGIKRDEHFGLVMTLGSGGIFADLLDDYQLLLLPAHRDEIYEKIIRLKVGDILLGYRGAEGTDLSKLLDCIEALISFVTKSNPSIIELEINPLFVFREKFVAVDALLAKKE